MKEKFFMKSSIHLSENRLSELKQFFDSDLPLTKFVHEPYKETNGYF